LERDHPGVTQELPRKLPPTGDKETQSHLSQKRYDRLALERERRVSRDHQGGARGIAADMALGFAAEGVHLAVCACTKADVEAKVKEIARATGAKVIGVPGGLEPQYLRRGKRKRSASNPNRYEAFMKSSDRDKPTGNGPLAS